MSAGFYKVDPTSGELLYAPNAVYGPGFTLTKDTPDESADGWQWFHSEADARQAHGLPSAA